MLKPALISAALIGLLSSCSSTTEDKVVIDSRESAWNAFNLVDGATPPREDGKVNRTTKRTVVVNNTTYIAPLVYTTSSATTSSSDAEPIQHVMPGRGSALRASN